MMARMSFMAVDPWSRASLVNADRAIPDDEPAHNILPRPQTEASHDRFFEEGEEPPARYDLPDPVDYIEVNPEPIDSARWRRLGWEVGWFDDDVLHARVLLYYMSILFGLWPCVMPFLLILSPTLHAVIVNRSLFLLSDSERFGSFAWTTRTVIRFAVASLPVFVSRLIALFSLYMTGSAAYFAMEFTVNTFVGRSSKIPTGFEMITIPFWILAGLLIGVSHLFVAVRICGFAEHLILDYDLASLAAMRANFRITRGRTSQLMRLKLRLWFWKYLTGALTFGLGVLIYEPYVSAVWTAAYLDIAGSEPPREIPVRERDFGLGT
jgi:hypothetical protein